MARSVNMDQILKQAKIMEQQFAEAEESLKDEKVSASAGGGTVKVTVNSAMQIEELVIKPEALDPDDVEFLQDMVTAAVNEAMRGMNELVGKRMGAITGGMSIPGMSL